MKSAEAGRPSLSKLRVKMPSNADTDAVVVRRWRELPERGRFTADLDAIFFESSATRSFPDEQTRTAFRERWLGRYLAHDSRWFYAALLDGGRGPLVGYLAGAADDPAHAARFADIGYFSDLAEVTARYPAHLHINVASGIRSTGIGARLIAAFVADLRAAGCPGVHLVTGAGSRNVVFYRRNGFEEVKRFMWGDRDLVLLGRTLADVAGNP